MMASIVDEAGARVKEEVEYIKQQYNKKLEVLLHDMKKLEDVRIINNIDHPQLFF